MPLRKLYVRFRERLGIDLGTANIVVYARGRGVVLREPSVVAIDKATRRVLAVARRLVRCWANSRTIVAIRLCATASLPITAYPRHAGFSSSQGLRQQGQVVQNPS